MERLGSRSRDLERALPGGFGLGLRHAANVERAGRTALLGGGAVPGRDAGRAVVALAAVVALVLGGLVPAVVLACVDDVTDDPLVASLARTVRGAHFSLYACSALASCLAARKRTLRELLFVDDLADLGAELAGHVERLAATLPVELLAWLVPYAVARAGLRLARLATDETGSFELRCGAIEVHQEALCGTAAGRLAVFALLVSDVYQASAFLVMAALFRVVCGRSLLQLDDLLKRFGGDGPVPTRELLEAHRRLHDLVGRISHRFRFFLLSITLITTAEFFLVSFDLTVEWLLHRVYPLQRADLLMPFLLHMSTSYLVLRTAAMVSHRMRKLVKRFSTQAVRRGELEREQLAHGLDRLEASAARAEVLAFLSANPIALTVFGHTVDRDMIRSLHGLFVATSLFVLTRALGKS